MPERDDSGTLTEGSWITTRYATPCDLQRGCLLCRSLRAGRYNAGAPPRSKRHEHYRLTG